MDQDKRISMQTDIFGEEIDTLKLADQEEKARTSQEEEKKGEIINE